MDLQVYRGNADDNGAADEHRGAIITLPNGLQITEEEQEKRTRDVSL